MDMARLPYMFLLLYLLVSPGMCSLLIVVPGRGAQGVLQRIQDRGWRNRIAVSFRTHPRRGKNLQVGCTDPPDSPPEYDGRSP